MNNFQRVVAISLLFLFLFACSGGDEANGSATSAGSESFAAMGVSELDSFLADNQGKPTIAMVWTTWCPSCKQELPEMEKLYQSHGEKVNVIAISVDENASALEKYLADKPLDLPVYHGDNALARKFGIESIPTMLIFDKKGQLVLGEPGLFPHSMLSAMADKLAAQ